MLRGFRAVPEDSRFKVSAPTATFLAGGLSSNVFWMISFPFDAVKKCVTSSSSAWSSRKLIHSCTIVLLYLHSRLMTDSITHPKYPTWRSAAKQIWREGRVRVRFLFLFASLVELDYFHNYLHNTHIHFLPFYLPSGCLSRILTMYAEGIPNRSFFYSNSPWRPLLIMLRGPQNAAALTVWETTMRLLGAEQLVH